METMINWFPTTCLTSFKEESTSSSRKPIAIYSLIFIHFIDSGILINSQWILINSFENYITSCRFTCISFTE